jgi:hypothetical protein
MLDWCVGSLFDDFWAGVPRYPAEIARNALVEPFTLHFRVLYDFLWADPRRDDVSARHWFPDGHWEAKPTDALREARRRTNKEIAHLTYTRTTIHGDEWIWPREEIVEGLRTGSFGFLDRAPEDLLCPRFNSAWWQALPSPAATQSPMRLHVTESIGRVATQGCAS